MSNHVSTYNPQSRLAKWFDERLPIMRLVHDSFVDFPTPRNLNYLWTFGGILSFCLVAQIVTGIVLAMHYQPSAEGAFNSIEHIRRDVNFGWMIRNFHAVGASMFFVAVYIHIFRGLYYGSYKAPREILWILGVLIFLAMMATAFMGYALPWGQMSFWGVTVITNLFSSLDGIIPGVGTAIVEWLWGGYSVSGTTLNRFFSLHYLLPFVIAGVVGLHIWALHVVGQNNPIGIDIKTKADIVIDHRGTVVHRLRIPHPNDNVSAQSKSQIAAGVFVQTKGVGSAFQWARYCSIWRTSAGTERKELRRTDWRVRMPNHASMRLSHEAPVGVKWNWTRGWAASQAFTGGVEWVEELSKMTWSSCRG
mgnify:CR=1 FL=1